MKQKGFTLIEMMIVIAIIGILVSIFAGYSDDRTTCINGYLFAKGHNVTQILDDQGHGIKCMVK